MTMPERYTISVTRQQAQAIQHAMETVARLGMGQFDMALGYCRNAANTDDLDNYDIRNEVEAILKPKMGLSRNSSWGVGKFPTADLDWEIACSIRYTLAWDYARAEGLVKPDGSALYYGVQYHEPMKYTDVPLPVVKGEVT